MKKTLFFTALLMMAAGLAKAQAVDSIAHHYHFGPGSLGELSVNGSLALRDGTLLAWCQAFPLDASFQLLEGDGNLFYKIDPKGPSVVDSLFLENPPDSYYHMGLLDRNPLGDGNVWVKLVRDPETGATALCIRHFDDNLVFDDGQTALVALDGMASEPLGDGYCLDPQGNIVAWFYLQERQYHFLRVGLDGTVKAHRVYDDANGSSCPGFLSHENLEILSLEPLEFGFVSDSHKHRIFVLDAELDLKEVRELPNDCFNVFLTSNAWDRLLGCSDNSFLYTSTYWSGTYPSSDGVLVARYGKEGPEPLGSVRFPAAVPTLSDGMPLGLAPDGNGGFYYAYQEMGLGYNLGHVVVARLDHDLNVTWRRFCLEPEGYSRMTSANLVVMDDGTLALAGLNTERDGWMLNNLFFLFLNSYGEGLDESKACVRPYAFFPNPVGDRLSLEYSPDVAPTEVELYDLQGRLLLSQSDRLESIDMESLPAGIYTLKVTLSNGTSYSDKVVKR